jgi:hypothetical protein
VIRNVCRFDLVPDISIHSKVLVLVLGLFLTSCPGPAFAASPDGSQQGAGSTAPKSEAAEAWDAVKNTTNPALLQAFIKRYGATFFAELAKARLDELTAAAAKPRPIQTIPTGRSQSLALPMPANGVREQAVLYEEDPTTPKGRQYAGSVTWHTETIKTAGKPDELAARADVDIPSRGLRMTMSLRRNGDPSLPASHVIEMTLAVPADLNNGGVANVPGILMKSNLEARGAPLAGLAVKVTDGFFLVGLSSVAADLQRNVKLVLEKEWVDIPLVYANHRRAILAIDKGESGDQVFKTVFTAWGQYPAAAQPAAGIPADDGSNGSAR